MKTITNTTSPVFALLAFACVALSPQARAVCQQGCDLSNASTFLGDDALVNNIGINNTAIGFAALEFNTTGVANTATGVDALLSNTTGVSNTAIGEFTLFENTIGYDNTAMGSQALFSNATGFYNTAIGARAGLNTTGSRNTAVGWEALRNTTSGSGNIALGVNAGMNLSTGSNNIDIGNAGAANKSNEIRIGTNGTHTNTFIAGISGVTVADGVAVIIDARGHLGTVVSSERFKDEIKPMDKASEVILALQPVTFRYKHELDPEGIRQFGLVAEEVEKVNPDLVARDADGKAYTVRYEAVNAMLLNEFLKAHRKIDEQERRAQQQDSAIAELRSQVQVLTAALKDQTAQIQKVSAELELSKAAPQMVLSNQ